MTRPNSAIATRRRSAERLEREATDFYVLRVVETALSRDAGCARALSSRPFPIADLIARYPRAAWDWRALSANARAAPLDFALANRALGPWRWSLIAARSREALERVSEAGLVDPTSVRVRIELARAGLLDPPDLRAVVREMTADERDDVARHETYHAVIREFPELGWASSTVSIYSSLDAFVADAETRAPASRALDVRYLVAPRLGPRTRRALDATLAIQAAWRRAYARRVRAANAIQRAAADAYWNPRRRFCRDRLARDAAELGCVRVGSKRSRSRSPAGADDAAASTSRA